MTGYQSFSLGAVAEAQGDVVSVDRGRDHHFGNITEDLAILVIFAPPDTPDA